ncbi:uncharacterized protein B0J16DRAFT_332818 [Fusarium flagelliforme]|uniref:uncharacterized protein n=1 Tax=Fusarium flagelliforme TaxID=2675880 RepID=UPI001E8E7A73|nr:uncharacterized protein B0J16DRAFT_332818 [Fusarium flagelliforme]KAH7192321.1 hypothetical protein B0J16DRAFT_332818 [Fusarium flagelliforme]
MIFAVAGMIKNNHSLYDCLEYGIRAVKHQRCGISRPRYMSTWIVCLLARQLTPLSPMENRRTPDDSFVMQHRQWSLFRRGENWSGH